MRHYPIYSTHFVTLMWENELLFANEWLVCTTVHCTARTVRSGIDLLRVISVLSFGTFGCFTDEFEKWVLLIDKSNRYEQEVVHISQKNICSYKPNLASLLEFSVLKWILTARTLNPLRCKKMFYNWVSLGYLMISW